MIINSCFKIPCFPLTLKLCMPENLNLKTPPFEACDCYPLYTVITQQGSIGQSEQSIAGHGDVVMA